jgi:hypothetical protein
MMRRLPLLLLLYLGKVAPAANARCRRPGCATLERLVGNKSQRSTVVEQNLGVLFK